MGNLSDLDRRVIGNLTIPRNADDLAAHLRGFASKVGPEGVQTYYSAAEVDTMLRGDLEKRGLVKHVGQADDAAKLASKLQKDKDLIDLPDEKAEIYASRMQRRDLSWRLDGDLWMLTEEGLKLLHEQPDDAPPAMTPQQVQATIDAEYARVHKGDIERDEDGAITNVNLSNKLLEEEFFTWLDLVLEDARGRWGEMAKDLHGPMAGGASGYSDAYEIAVLDAENQKTALGAVVDPWYMGLSIVALTDADTGTTIEDGTHKPTYTGYAKKSVAGTDMNAGSGTSGSVTNANAIIFAACTAGTSTIIAAANCSQSASGGTMRKWFDVASTVISTTQTPAQFAAGAYTTTLA